jgi:hypothetical protein
VEDAFAAVLVAVVVIGVVVAVITLAGSGKAYEGIGRGAFSLDESEAPEGPEPGSPAARAETEAEVRQMLEAKSARRVARGEAPLDVDAETAALMRAEQPAMDEALRDEVRQLVVARNDRRIARGEEPLDVEAEVERQLRDLT